MIAALPDLAPLPIEVFHQTGEADRERRPDHRTSTRSRAGRGATGVVGAEPVGERLGPGHALGRIVVDTSRDVLAQERVGGTDLVGGLLVDPLRQDLGVHRRAPLLAPGLADRQVGGDPLGQCMWSCSVLLRLR